MYSLNLLVVQMKFLNSRSKENKSQYTFQIKHTIAYKVLFDWLKNIYRVIELTVLMKYISLIINLWANINNLECP